MFDNSSGRAQGGALPIVTEPELSSDAGPALGPRQSIFSDDRQWSVQDEADDAGSTLPRPRVNSQPLSMQPASREVGDTSPAKLTRRSKSSTLPNRLSGALVLEFNRGYDDDTGTGGAPSNVKAGVLSSV